MRFAFLGAQKHVERLPDERVILQQADGTLVIHDGDGPSTPLEPDARGPFGLEPAWGRWYVTAIDEADKGDETSLVVDIVLEFTVSFEARARARGGCLLLGNVLSTQTS